MSANLEGNSPKVGRPSDYTEELGQRICFDIAEGKTLTAICRADDMPHRSTVIRWTFKHDEFRVAYMHARDIQTDIWADETVDISDDSSSDYVERTRDDGSTYTTVDHDHIARSRLRVDTRKWLASKLKASKYGDRIAHEHTGPNGGPIQHEDTRERNLSAIEQLSARLASPAAGAPPGPTEGAGDSQSESGAES